MYTELIRFAIYGIMETVLCCGYAGVTEERILQSYASPLCVMRPPSRLFAGGARPGLFAAPWHEQCVQSDSGE